MSEAITVGEAFTIRKGKKVDECPRSSSTVRYIQIDDLRCDDNIKYCEQDSSIVKATPNDIIIAWDGANAGTCGYGLEGIIGSTLALLSPKTDLLDSKYAGLYLKSQFQYLRDNCTGATIPHISKPVLQEIEIPLLEKDVQLKIVQVYEKVLSLISKRKEQLTLMEKLVQDTFIDMFGDPVSNPMGWKTARISELASVRIGPFGSFLHVEDYTTGGIPLINPQHMVNGIISPKSDFAISEDKYEKMQSYHLYENDIVLGRRGEIGRCAVVEAEHLPAICATGSMIVRPDTGIINSKYLHSVFYQPSFAKELEGKATGSTMKNINASIVNSLVIPVPPIELQREYEKALFIIKKQKNCLQASFAEMETTYKSILQKAFSGELF
jgi:type I restriction enzyme S subunit